MTLPFIEVLLLIPTQKSGTKKNGHSSQTHCQYGHEFNEENTYISPKSQKRSCKICNHNRWQLLISKNPEEARYKNRKHMQEWRAANKKRDNQNWTRLRREKYEWVKTFKTVCYVCGESDPVCLDFHHKDPAIKVTEISLAIARWSKKRIKEEMDKCELICANCHRKLHAQERAELKEG